MDQRNITRIPEEEIPRVTQVLAEAAGLGGAIGDRARTVLIKLKKVQEEDPLKNPERITKFAEFLRAMLLRLRHYPRQEATIKSYLPIVESGNEIPEKFWEDLCYFGSRETVQFVTRDVTASTLHVPDVSDPLKRWKMIFEMVTTPEFQISKDQQKTPQKAAALPKTPDQGTSELASRLREAEARAHKAEALAAHLQNELERLRRIGMEEYKLHQLRDELEEREAKLKMREAELNLREGEIIQKEANVREHAPSNLSSEKKLPEHSRRKLESWLKKENKTEHAFFEISDILVEEFPTLDDRRLLRDLAGIHGRPSALNTHSDSTMGWFGFYQALAPNEFDKVIRVILKKY